MLTSWVLHRLLTRLLKGTLFLNFFLYSIWLIHLLPSWVIRYSSIILWRLLFDNLILFFFRLLIRSFFIRLVLNLLLFIFFLVLTILIINLMALLLRYVSTLLRSSFLSWNILVLLQILRIVWILFFLQVLFLRTMRLILVFLFMLLFWRRSFRHFLFILFLFFYFLHKLIVVFESFAMQNWIFRFRSLRLDVLSLQSYILIHHCLTLKTWNNRMHGFFLRIVALLNLHYIILLLLCLYRNTSNLANFSRRGYILMVFLSLRRSWVGIDIVIIFSVEFLIEYVSVWFGCQWYSFLPLLHLLNDILNLVPLRNLVKFGLRNIWSFDAAFGFGFA